MRESTRRWFAGCAIALLAAMLTACNGSSTSGTTPSGVVPPVMQNQTAPVAPELNDDDDSAPAAALNPITIYPGEVVGTDNMFRPKDGDTAAGGQGNKLGKLQCSTTEYISAYHVHAYLGIIYKGKQVAVPDAIGLIHPGHESNGYISTAGCFYYIHTHDASGLIHIEDPTMLPPSAEPYKLEVLLKLWGIKATAGNFGRFFGRVHVFVGNVAQLGQTQVTSYVPHTSVATLGSISLKSHEAIWVVIGKPYFKASQLPSVTFYTEY